jgi:hypothetical protein
VKEEEGPLLLLLVSLSSSTLSVLNEYKNTASLKLAPLLIICSIIGFHLLVVFKQPKTDLNDLFEESVLYCDFNRRVNLVISRLLTN